MSACLRTGLASAFAAIAILTGGAIATADAPAPTPGQLQSTLDQFADPGVPTGAKTQLMVNGGAHSGNIDRMNQGLRDYGHVGFTVSNVQANGNIANAKVAIVSPHGTMPGVPMSWQNTGAGWELTESTGCAILAMSMQPC
jgi:hypothetical protein